MSFGPYDYAAFAMFFAYAAASVVVPVVLVRLARDLGFSLEQGGMSEAGALHLGRTVAVVASMVLSGFAAGRWGKRRTLGASVVLMGLGIGACALAPAYSVLFVSLIAAGLGEGVIEGLGTPFVQSLHPDESGRYNNFTHAFWSVGVMATVLVSGALLSTGLSWRCLVGGTAVLGFVAASLLLAPSRKHPFPEHPEPIHWTTVWGQALAIMRRRGFWLFFAAMFLAGGGEFALTFWCASFIQLNFLDAAWAGGVGTACFAGGMVLGRTGWGYLVHQQHLRRLILASAAGGVLVTLGLPHVGSLWLLFGLLFLSGVATAPFWPSLQTHCADRLPGTDTTMLFILLACAGVPGCGVFAWVMGYLGNRAGGDLARAFYLVPASYLALGGLVAYDGWRAAAHLRSTRRSA
jgi:MFS family permease